MARSMSVSGRHRGPREACSLCGDQAGGVGRLIVETIVRIQREHADGASIRAIGPDLRLSRRVVRKSA